MILIQSKQADLTVSQEYLNNTGLPVIIDKLVGRNDGGAPQTLTVHLVPAGSTPDATNKLLTTAIAAAATDLCHAIVGFDLAPGDSIWLGASAVNTITVRASGRSKKT